MPFEKGNYFIYHVPQPMLMNAPQVLRVTMTPHQRWNGWVCNPLFNRGDIRQDLSPTMANEKTNTKESY